MNVSIVSRGEIKLVGIKVVGRRSELSHRVPFAWTELVKRLDSIPHRVEPDVFYGCFPESEHLRASADGVHTYQVCTEVSGFGPTPEGLHTLVLPARTYATARVQGTAEAIDATYIGLARWLEEQGRRTHAQAHGFERYDQRRQKVTPPYERFDYDLFKPLAD
ncbi:GyrI-like domain-containing protein [Myxococcus sp. RHSTA-1-4]|uniref:GyrI-like domain-containing protein n=1 Tax=Myxococcus sp. RHSTA-1-4 TaxID=2874601 RepID=UPI001CBB4813|nr:GyrI-like domain-containing protein [Myxococcus sp. RHSTA-1-4]MBZ4416639.1 GyrI-like domain-containing protein [Myxococcus sp. RHSTA-1-4]